MKIYNPKAPLHYQKYWSLQDNEKDLEKMASSILLKYLQSWGQTNEERLQTLAGVANSIGFHIEIIEKETEHFFKVPNKESERFESFREKIRNISRENFEDEVVQIAGIVKAHRIKKSWHNFWR